MKIRDYLLERLEFKCSKCGNIQQFSLMPSDKQRKCPECGGKLKEIGKTKLAVRKSKY